MMMTTLAAELDAHAVQRWRALDADDATLAALVGDVGELCARNAALRTRAVAAERRARKLQRSLDDAHAQTVRAEAHARRALVAAAAADDAAAARRDTLRVVVRDRSAELETAARIADDALARCRGELERERRVCADARNDCAALRRALDDADARARALDGRVAEADARAARVDDEQRAALDALRADAASARDDADRRTADARRNADAAAAELAEARALIAAQQAEIEQLQSDSEESLRVAVQRQTAELTATLRARDESLRARDEQVARLKEIIVRLRDSSGGGDAGASPRGAPVASPRSVSQATMTLRQPVSPRKSSPSPSNSRAVDDGAAAAAAAAADDDVVDTEPAAASRRARSRSQGKPQAITLRKPSLRKSGSGDDAGAGGGTS